MCLAMDLVYLSLLYKICIYWSVMEHLPKQHILGHKNKSEILKEEMYKLYSLTTRQ